MSYTKPNTYEAAGTVTKYAVVKFDSAGKVVVATDPTEANVVGVVQRADSAGELLDVITHGETRAIAGAALADFSATPLLSVTTSGKLKASVATNFPIAQVRPNINQVSAVDGDEITVFFSGPSVVKA